MVSPATAQVVSSDNTLNTTVNRSVNDFTITNGTAAGTNLFHSFREFSIPTNGAATFDLVNTPGISTIFSRVTGSNLSNIDGVIRSINSSNPVSLFLMNPNGIIFGPNAQINLGGSFVGTTASGIKFSSGETFASSETPLPAALLTINTPIGLQFGPMPGPIEINQSALTLQPGNAFVLVGGNLAQSGGSIATQGGPIALASIQQSGMVTIAPDWQLGFSGLTNFGDITIGDRAYDSTNGEAGGTFQLVGRRIQVTGYSILESVTLGAQNGGKFTVQASDSLELTGLNSNGSEFSYIQTYTDPASTGRSGDLHVTAPTIVMDGTTLTSATIGFGDAGNLTVDTDRLILRQGAQIGTFTFASGNAGDLTVKATDSIDISGSFRTFLPLENLTRTFSSGLYANLERGGTGNGGNLTVETDRLRIADGGRVTTSVDPSAQGNAGNLAIRARDIVIDGVTVDEVGAYSGLLANVPAGTSGQSGTMVINTDRLSVLNGGQLSASNLGTGAAGGVEINARVINLSGVSNEGQIPSRISASSASDSSAGFVKINAGAMTLNDRSVISVSSLGTGDAGNLMINANTLFLNRSTLQSDVGGGSQGNIDLNITGAIVLRHESKITTAASSTSTGGNIKISAPILVGIENSDIIANAVRGQGGNIQISTNALLGLQYRPTLTPNNDITASSEFGLNGTVQINTLSLDPSSGLIGLPSAVTDPSRQISAGCGAAQNNRFIVTGRGGIPRNPLQKMNPDRVWHDLRSSSLGSQTLLQPPSPVSSIPRLIEATALDRNTQTGELTLVAGNIPKIFNPATCGSL